MLCYHCTAIDVVQVMRKREEAAGVDVTLKDAQVKCAIRANVSVSNTCSSSRKANCAMPVHLDLVLITCDSSYSYWCALNVVAAGER